MNKIKKYYKSVDESSIWKKYKPLLIIENVLDNVKENAICSFLMPNSKLRTDDKNKKLLKNHTLLKIIKLPNIFAGMASTGDVSIFIFKAHQPHKDRDVIGFNIYEDGLTTVKNQGRHDTNGIWTNELEDYWVKSIQNGDDPKYTDDLEYPSDEVEFNIYREDFEKVVLDRILFENPEIAKYFNKKSNKNNDGLTQNDWIVFCLKNICKS